jgi:DNA-binding SARP family transcriptional activator/DNA-binding transcriptional ArsR family regulator
VIEFRVLGPLVVYRNSVSVDLRAPMLRRLLAVLLCRVGRSLSAGELVDALWSGDAPSNARKVLHVHVHRLRRAIADDRVIRYGPAGYSAVLAERELDALRFVAVVESARALRRPASAAQASALYREALGLWRGTPYGGVSAGTIVEEEIRRLLDLRLLIYEELVDVELELGRHAELVAELVTLTNDEPYREGLRAQLMLALYRAGRQSQALEVYRQTHALFSDELGVEPGPQLQRLHAAMLCGDESLLGVARASVPAQLAGAPIARELPPDVAGFTGRAGVLKALDETLPGTHRTGPVVISVISGMAGIGKTALAVHWAHRVAHHFPDGQLYLNLRGYAAGSPVRPIAALAHLLRSLGTPAERVPVELDGATALHRSLLTGRRVLIVLDNARSVEQVRPLLPGSPGCLVLVTSRDRLGGLVARDGAHRFGLDGLSPGEAELLLVRTIGEQRAAAEPAAVAELAQVCAYLPLALRIAASNLADHPHRTVANHHARLRGADRLGALVVDGDEEAAVRAAFDLSYQSIPAEAQRLFRLLGLVPGVDFTAAAAGALLGVPEPQVERHLDQLARAHLIDQRGDGRFAFHDLLRQYAAEQADAEDGELVRASAVDRLLTWYLLMADAAVWAVNPQRLQLPLPAGLDRLVGVFAGPATALAWLDAERPNLVAVVRAAPPGHGHVSWLLADRLRDYFDRRRHPVDWLAVAHAGLASANACGDLPGQAASTFSLAHARYCLGQWDHTLTLLHETVRTAEQVGWARGVAGVHASLGLVYHLRGRRADALDHLDRSLAISRHRGYLQAEADALNTLALLNLEWGRPRDAIDSAARAAEMFRRLGAAAGESAARDTLGTAYQLLGELGRAEHHIRAALAAAEASGGQRQRAAALAVLASLLRDAGRTPAALVCARAALPLAAGLGDPSIEASTYGVLASIQQVRGEYQEALANCRRAAELTAQIGVPFWIAIADLGLAASYHRLSRPAEALAHVRSALELANRLEYPVVEGRSATLLAQILLIQDETGQARALALRSVELHRQTGYRLGEARALQVLAQAVGRTDGPEAAQPLRQAARELFVAIGAPA